MLRRIKQKLMSHFSIVGRGDASLVLGMGVTGDREKGTVILPKEKYTKSLLKQYGMASCNPTYAPDLGRKLSLDQPREGISKEERQRLMSLLEGNGTLDR